MSECKATACSRQVPGNMLMCRPHWAKVPPGIKREVYRAWEAILGGDVKGIDDHAKATAAAVEAVELSEPECL
jgi:hypothetical protein